MSNKFNLDDRVLHGSHMGTGFEENDVVFWDGWFKGNVKRVNEDGSIRYMDINGSSYDAPPQQFQAVAGTITSVEDGGPGDVWYQFLPDDEQICNGDPMYAHENKLTAEAPPPTPLLRRSTRFKDQTRNGP